MMVLSARHTCVAYLKIILPTKICPLFPACSCTEVQNRCLNILAKLYHAPSADQPDGTDQKWNAVGTATIGSSEAIMLGALALKKRWQNARKAAGKDTSKPNLVMGRNTHVCWQK